jgi:uncharacterized lipoprotein YmbA
MRRLALILLFLGLAGCFTSGKRGTEKGLAIYDLGAPPAPLVLARPSLLAVEVRAPLWMDALGINYRLAYADPTRLREYALVRWAGPPAQMMQQRLSQQLALATAGQGRARCLVRIEINEFTQVFSSPDLSKGLLQGRAYWLDQARHPLAERVVDIERMADRPNSSGGVAALQAAVGQLAAEMQAWEQQLQNSGKLAGCSA